MLAYLSGIFVHIRNQKVMKFLDFHLWNLLKLLYRRNSILIGYIFHFDLYRLYVYLYFSEKHTKILFSSLILFAIYISFSTSVYPNRQQFSSTFSLLLLHWQRIRKASSTRRDLDYCWPLAKNIRQYVLHFALIIYKFFDEIRNKRSAERGRIEFLIDRI